MQKIFQFVVGGGVHLLVSKFKSHPARIGVPDPNSLPPDLRHGGSDIHVGIPETDC